MLTRQLELFIFIILLFSPYLNGEKKLSTVAKENEQNITKVNTSILDDDIFSETQYEFAITLLKQKKFKEAIVILEKYVRFYIAYCKILNCDKNTKKVMHGIGALVTIYKIIGDKKNATRLMGYFRWRSSWDERIDSYNDYNKLVKKLNTAEKIKKSGKSGWEKIIWDCLIYKKKAKPPKKNEGEDDILYKRRFYKYLQDINFAIEDKPSFESLRWKGSNFVIAHSYVQIARAYFVLGKIDDALKELQKGRDFIKAFDKACKDTGHTKKSPSGEFKYWAGRIFLEKSLTADKINKVKYLQQAFSKLIAVANQNKYKNHKYSITAFTYALKVEKYLKLLNVTVLFPEEFNPPHMDSK